MFRWQSHRPCRHNRLDEHPVVLHHHPIDHELYHLLLYLKRGLFHGPPDTGTQGVDAFEASQCSGALCSRLRDLLHPLPQHPPLVSSF